MRTLHFILYVGDGKLPWSRIPLTCSHAQFTGIGVIRLILSYQRNLCPSKRMKEKTWLFIYVHLARQCLLSLAGDILFCFSVVLDAVVKLCWWNTGQWQDDEYYFIFWLIRKSRTRSVFTTDDQGVADTTLPEI